MSEENEIYAEFASALEPPKRKPGRPAGSKNKKTLEWEAKMAKKNGTVPAKTNPPKKGKNAEEVEFTLRVMAIAKNADLEDVEGMKRQFIEYLQLCRTHDHKIGNLAAYGALGIDLNTAKSWQSPEGRRKFPERGYLVDAVNKICALYRESSISNGAIDKVTGIFWQKSLDGFREDPELATANDPVDLGKSPDAIAEKYKTLPKV